MDFSYMMGGYDSENWVFSPFRWQQYGSLTYFNFEEKFLGGFFTVLKLELLTHTHTCRWDQSWRSWPSLMQVSTLVLAFPPGVQTNRSDVSPDQQGDLPAM